MNIGTATALATMMQFSKEYGGMLLFSPGMTKEQLYFNLSKYLRRPPYKMNGKNDSRLSPEEVARELDKFPCYIDDTPNISLGELSERTRKCVREKGIGVLMVYGLKHLPLQGPSIFGTLKALGEELGIESLSTD